MFLIIFNFVSNYLFSKFTELRVDITNPSA